MGGDPELVGEIALWVVPAGIIGGRIYFDITTPMDIPHVWYGPFAVWSGGLGIWGGVLVGGLVGVWRLRRRGVSPALFADAMAPGLLIAQGIGRIGNYFNKELFGRPTSLPWGLEIPYQYRVSGGIPAADLHFATFQPTFLYELIFDFAWAGVLIWLGHRYKIKPPGLFALYVFGYSAYRIFEESLRIDSSVHIFGLRLNMYIASVLTVVGAVWFYRSQRRPARALAAVGPADAGVLLTPRSRPATPRRPRRARHRRDRRGRVALGHVDTAGGADAVHATGRKWLTGPRGVGAVGVTDPRGIAPHRRLRPDRGCPSRRRQPAVAAHGPRGRRRRPGSASAPPCRVHRGGPGAASGTAWPPSAARPASPCADLPGWAVAAPAGRGVRDHRATPHPRAGRPHGPGPPARSSTPLSPPQAPPPAPRAR